MRTLAPYWAVLTDFLVNCESSFYPFGSMKSRLQCTAVAQSKQSFTQLQQTTSNCFLYLT